MNMLLSNTANIPYSTGSAFGMTPSLGSVGNLPAPSLTRQQAPPPVLDMSEFPALGSAPTTTTGRTPMPVSGGLTGFGSTVAGSSTVRANRPFTSDDFPELGVAVNINTRQGSGTTQSTSVSQRRDTAPASSVMSTAIVDEAEAYSNGLASRTLRGYSDAEVNGLSPQPFQPKILKNSNILL